MFGATPALSQEYMAWIQQIEHPCFVANQIHEIDHKIRFQSPGSLYHIGKTEREAYRLAGLIIEEISDRELENARTKRINDWFSDHLSATTIVLHQPRKAKPDRYGRVAIWPVRRANGSTSMQELLLKEGLARLDLHSLTTNCAKHLLTLEEDARRAERGLWSLSQYKPKRARPDHLSAHLSSYQLVHGRVLSVHRSKKRTSYLNFGHHWKTDFTIALGIKHLRQWEREHNSLEALEGKTIYVRGWIEPQNGPLIRITHPMQLTYDVGDTTSDNQSLEP